MCRVIAAPVCGGVKRKPELVLWGLQDACLDVGRPGELVRRLWMGALERCDPLDAPDP